MRVVVCLAAMAVLMVAPAPGFAQEMMMHGTPLEGIVTKVEYTSCGSTPQSCQGIIQVTSAQDMEMMMHATGMEKEHMMVHPVRIIIVPGAAATYQGAAQPITKIHAGDHVKLEYHTVGDMNVAISLAVTEMGMKPM